MESDPATTAVVAINQSWTTAFNSDNMVTLAERVAKDAILYLDNGATLTGQDDI